MRDDDRQQSKIFVPYTSLKYARLELINVLSKGENKISGDIKARCFIGITFMMIGDAILPDLRKQLGMKPVRKVSAKDHAKILMDAYNAFSKAPIGSLLKVEQDASKHQSL